MNPPQTFSFVNAAKETCATPTCPHTNLAKACTRRLCSKCCRAFSTPCGYAKHQEKRTAQQLAHLAAAADRHAPPTLAHPPPVRMPQDPEWFVPPLPSEGTQGEVVEARSFEKAMYAPFRSLWDRKVAEREADAKAEQQRRDSQKALAHSIDLMYWREDHAPPERRTIQGIKTWPTFVVQQSPSACTFLGLSSDTAGHFEVYSLSGLYWQTHNICDVFSVSKNELLLFRRSGVSHCHGLDNTIDEARNRLRSPSAALSPIQVTVMHTSKPARSSAKRPREDGSSGLSGARASSVPRLSLAHSSPFSSSMSPLGITAAYTGVSYLQDVSTHRMPTSLPDFASDSSVPTESPQASSSPSLGSSSLSPIGLGFLGFSPAPTPTIAPAMSVPSPLPSLPRPLVAQSPHPTSGGTTSPPAAASPDNLSFDAPPDLRPIHTSPSAITQWPAGMYACDMARGFTLMASSKRTNLKDRFHDVFPGVHFKRNTVYRHYNAWRFSTEAERQTLLALPRTTGGLYKPHSKKLSGWAKLQS